MPLAEVQEPGRNFSIIFDMLNQRRGHIASLKSADMAPKLCRRDAVV